ncbi:RNA-directed DNA polymerase, eukaryota [Tanacetum coccineum]
MQYTRSGVVSWFHSLEEFDEAKEVVESVLMDITVGEGIRQIHHVLQVFTLVTKLPLRLFDFIYLFYAFDYQQVVSELGSFSHNEQEYNEGFGNVKLSYMGGHWVLLKMDFVDSKDKIIEHVGVNSWFVELKHASNSFVCEEQLVWVLVEGLPVKAHTYNTFAKILSSWGELVDIDDTDASSLSPIRVCVKTKPCVLINDRIKIIIKGHLHMICVKELAPWTPEFKTDTEEDHNSDGESKGTHENDLENGKHCEYDHVSERSFNQEHDTESQKIRKSHEKSVTSEDPFGICFTPVVEENNVGSGNSPQPTHVGSQKVCSNSDISKSANKMNFLSLNVQGLGNKAKQGWIQELNIRHRVNLVSIHETKMDNMDLFTIKKLWVNATFDYAFSPSIGYFGGILCVWDPRLFVKDYSLDSDSFLVVSGIWSPTSTKLLIISVYAPHDLNERRMLWDYFRHLLDSWDGECALLERANLFNELHDLNKASSLELAQKAKIRWAIEGDENLKFFHGIINKKRSQLAIRGILVDGDWIVNPSSVKNEFLKHFSNRFAAPVTDCITFASSFPNQLTPDQVIDLESSVDYDEIKRAVWDCGTNKSPGPDGFTFEFFQKYWKIIDRDVVADVSSFFSSGSLPPGCNSSFIALIPETQEAKMVKDFRPISLIGSVYKIITKVLANRLSHVISNLVSDVQSAFIPDRQILDGPFILNKLLSWWCLNSVMGYILVNGSPTTKFKFFKGLKQGDPLSPFLFILVMESLHLSFNNMVKAGLFKGTHINDSLILSHLFYADDVIFIGEWNLSNIPTIVNVLKWFHLASGLKINLHKSKLMGIGIPQDVVASSARSIGSSILLMPFHYLGVMFGGSMSKISSWDDVVAKLSSRLSKCKLKTLMIGGVLTLIKSVLSSLPLYFMSSFKVPTSVLKKMKSIRRNFFNGVDIAENKMSLISWKKVLASKKNGGLGV